FVIFFFQAEDGIRDFHVTGVQTCALPILCKFSCKKLGKDGKAGEKFGRYRVLTQQTGTLSARSLETPKDIRYERRIYKLWYYNTPGNSEDVSGDAWLGCKGG